MYKNIVYFFLSFFLLTPFISISQKKCGTETKRYEALLRNPSLSKELEMLKLFTQEWIEKYDLTKSKEAVVKIPVVVHVVWRTTDQNISDQQIKSQIDILNKDFRKLNTDFNKTPSVFTSLIADVGIEFCLAARDPSGMVTNGITRTKTTVSDIGDKDRWYSTIKGGKDPWNVKKYINIWVCEAGADLFGFAFLPGTADPIEADGLVISSQYFGNVGTAIASYPNHKGRTTTHEMGHYFNLEHLWGYDEGGCEEDDEVTDTPLQFEETYDCPSFPLRDECTPAGSGILFFNYMDYVDDECMYMFTEGQKKRMLAALNGSRSSLLGQTNCSLSTNINSLDALYPPEIYPNPSGRFIQINSASNLGKSTQIFLYDYLGRMIQSKSSQGSCTFDLNGYSTGVYWIKIEGYEKTYKLIVSM